MVHYFDLYKKARKNSRTFRINHTKQIQRECFPMKLKDQTNTFKINMQVPIQKGSTKVFPVLPKLANFIFKYYVFTPKNFEYYFLI